MLLLLLSQIICINRRSLHVQCCSFGFVPRRFCFDVRCKSLNVILIGSVIIASVLYVQGTRSEVIRVISILYVLTSNNTTHKIENKRKARPENKKLTRPTLPSFILAKCTIPPHPFWILTHDSYEWQLTLTTKGDFYKWWLQHVHCRDGGPFIRYYSHPSFYLSKFKFNIEDDWMNQSMISLYYFPSSFYSSFVVVHYSRAAQGKWNYNQSPISMTIISTRSTKNSFLATTSYIMPRIVLFLFFFIPAVVIQHDLLIRWLLVYNNKDVVIWK